MYYEEKFINGKLSFRNMPDGEWQLKTTSVALVANQLILMTEDERADLFSLFCTHCGSDDPSCQCWNDD